MFAYFFTAKTMPTIIFLFLGANKDERLRESVVDAALNSHYDGEVPEARRVGSPTWIHGYDDRARGSIFPLLLQSSALPLPSRERAGTTFARVRVMSARHAEKMEPLLLSACGKAPRLPDEHEVTQSESSKKHGRRRLGFLSSFEIPEKASATISNDCRSEKSSKAGGPA